MSTANVTNCPRSVAFADTRQFGEAEQTLAACETAVSWTLALYHGPSLGHAVLRKPLPAFPKPQHLVR